MMKKFEKYLARLEKRQKWMIYISTFFILLMTVHSFTTPLIEEHEALVNQVETLQTSIANNTTSNLKKEIVLKNKILLEINTQIEKQKEDITGLMSSLYAIQYAFFNEKEFANALDAMLHKSMDADLHIDYIKNIPLSKESTAQILKHKKRMEIRGDGGYKEIVSFVNHIENLNTLIKFDIIKLTATDKRVGFMLLLDIYGLGL